MQFNKTNQSTVKKRNDRKGFQSCKINIKKFINVKC